MNYVFQRWRVVGGGCIFIFNYLYTSPSNLARNASL